MRFRRRRRRSYRCFARSGGRHPPPPEQRLEAGYRSAKDADAELDGAPVQSVAALEADVDGIKVPQRNQADDAAGAGEQAHAEKDAEDKLFSARDVDA